MTNVRRGREREESLESKGGSEGEGEIPSHSQLGRPRFPRSNKWRMEMEAGAQNMVGVSGVGREIKLRSVLVDGD